MDGPALADAVDPSDSLLEPHRVPRQLEVDHDAAPMVEIQPFARRIGRQKDVAAAADEGVERSGPFLARHAAVQERHRPIEHVAEVKQRVAVFGENHDRFGDAVQQADDGRELGLACAGGARGVG